MDSLTKEMVHDYGSYGLQRWLRNRQGSPTLIVGPIRNSTAQPIDTDLLGKDLKKSILARSLPTDDSIQVRWDKEFLCQTRRERRERMLRQCGPSTRPTSPDASLGLAEDRGAEFILVGSVHPSDAERRRRDRPESYALILRLTNVEAKSEAWSAVTKIERIDYWFESSPRSPEDSVRCRSAKKRSQMRIRQC